MANNKVLKFQVAIQDNATKGLEEIEKRFLGLSNKAVTVVGNINNELKKIGGVSFNMPDLSKMIGQLNNLQDTVLKKNVGDIPIFKNTLEQMQQLQNFIGKNTLSGELNQIKRSINGVFAEIPNVNANSFTNYFNQLNKAYNDFLSKMGNSRTVPKEVSDISGRVRAMGGLAGNNSLLREYQAQAEQIKATIINTINETKNSIEATKALLSSKALDFGKISGNIDKTAESLNKLSEAFTKFNGTIGGDKNLLNMMTGMGEIIRNVRLSMSQLQQGQENLNWGKSMQDNVKSILQARAEFEKLVPLIEKLKTQQLLSKNLGLDTSNIDSSIQRVQHLQQLLASITMNGGLSVSKIQGLSGLNASQLMSAHKDQLVMATNDLAAQSQANVQALKNEAFAQKENELAKRQTAATNSQLTNEESRLAQAIQQATNSAHGQSQVLSDLKSMAFQYLSVWGATQIASDITNITGELELQKKSLEVILNNASAAQQMYSEIRNLSQESPYTFESLLKSHRQLAAFGIEAKDIFATMKSLSDIGAGLDVDISRLILAFGHTRSYGYLSGIQNRQFENAGIDMIGGLADKYNKLAEAEKRAGNYAEFVTRKDIFSRMRDRSIPFEDVQDVILDLDRPGGKFYNMQERQYETLGGKLRNLHNNYRIMMSEIGQANHGILMGSVNIINNLTENWSKYATILTNVLIPLGAMKVAMLAVNSVMGKQAIAAASAIQSQQRLATMQREMLSMQNNTAYIWGNAQGKPSVGNFRQQIGYLGGNVRGWGADSKFDNATDFRKSLTDSGMSRNNLLRLSLNKNLSNEFRMIAGQMAGLNDSAQTFNANLTGWSRRVRLFGLNLASVGSFMKGMGAAIFNPMTAAFAALSAVTSIINRMRDVNAQAEELASTIRETSQTDIKGLQEILDNNSSFIGNTSTTSITRNGQTATWGHIIDLNQAELDGRNIEDIFKELKLKLQQQSPMYDRDIVDIEKAESQADKLKAILQKLEDIKYAKQVEQLDPDSVSNAAAHTGNWDTFGEAAKEFQDEMKNFSNQAQQITDTQWNSIAESERKKIMEYGQTRDEAMRNAFLHGDVYMQSSVASITGYRKGLGRFFKDGLLEEFSDVQKQSGNLVSTLTSALTNSFKDSPDAFSEYFEDMMAKVFTQAKVDDPFVQMQIKNYLMRQIEQSIQDLQISPQTKVNLQKGITQKYLENQILAQYASLLQPELKDTTTDAQADVIAKKKWQKVLNWAKSMGPELYNTALKNGKLQAEGLRQGLKAVRIDEQWKKDYMSYIQRNKKLQIAVKNASSPEAFLEEAKKIREEAKRKLKAMESTLRYNLGIKVGVNVDASELRKQIEALKNPVKIIKEGGRIGKDGKKHRLGDSYQHNGITYTMTGTKAERTKLKAFELANSILPDAEAFEMLENMGKKEHINWDDVGNKKGKNGHSNTYHDEFSKRWDERIRIMKEAYDWYDKWEKKVGNDASIKEVNAKYGDIFKEWKTDKLLPMDFDVKQIKDYQVYIEKIRDDALTRYQSQKNDKSRNYGQEALRVYRQAIALLSDISFDKFERNSDRWASKISLWLDRLTKKWEQYNKVLTATGDKQLAMSLSGFNVEKYQNVADALRDKISDQLKGYGVRYIQGFDADASDKEIEDSVKNMLGKEVDADKIKGVVEEMTKWRDLQRQINEESVETYANLIGGLVDLGTELNKINAEYENTLRKLNDGLRNGKITKAQYYSASSIASSKRDARTLESSAGYKNFFSSVWAQSIKSATEMANIIKQGLNKQFKAGIISAKDYAKKIEDVNAQLQKIRERKSDVHAFMDGGLNGIYQNRYNQGQGLFNSASNAFDTAKSQNIQLPNGMSMKNLGGMSNASSMMGKAGGMMQGAQGAMSTMAIIDKIVNGINDAVQQLKGILDDLANTLDYVNGKGDKFRGSGAYGFMGAFSQASQGAADGWNSFKNGDIMGTARGVIKSWTGWYTGFAQHHDSKLERQIEKLREDVTKIEGYTQTISKAQERTLGYDNGGLIRAYQRQYTANSYQLKMLGKTFSFNKEGAAGKAMSDYYNAAGGGDINGYQQQYNLLIKKRQDYIDMYNKEDAKKKKSQASLDETKQKIAELDDQMRYFSEDLAKNLWGIDVKSWAGQLSDALANAFENGENAANAYGDTVRNILQSVASKMMQMEVLEPMFKRLKEKLFGNGGDKKGVVDPKDMAGSARRLSGVVADFFGKNGEGQKALLGAREFMESYEKGLKDAGLSLRNNSNSTLSSGIQGTSEETSALLAGYINALRQDVSVISLMQTQFINEAWPDYVKQITGMATTLGRIDANVAAIRSIISENGELYKKVATLSDDIHNVIFGSQRLHIA